MKKSNRLPVPNLVLAGFFILALLPGICGQDIIKENTQGVINMKSFVEGQNPGEEEAYRIEDMKALAPKKTGYLYYSDNTDRVIGNLYTEGNVWGPPGSDELPPNATITNVELWLMVTDNGNVSNFYPADYEVYVRTLSTEQCVYNNRGVVTSHTDEGFDDDSENDADIEIGSRDYHYFDGESADQLYQFRIVDNHSPGEGKLRSVALKISWEAPSPNLDARFWSPEGWSAPMVINHSLDAYTNESPLYAGIDTYIHRSFKNWDFSIPNDYQVQIAIMVDGVHSSSSYRMGAAADAVYSGTSMRPFTAGEHTICQEVDPSDKIWWESDETDNKYCRTYTFIGPPAAPALSSPAHMATCQSTSVTLSWSSSAYATAYILQLDDNEAFSSPKSGTVTATSQLVTELDANTTYYWRVRGLNPAGTGSFSAARSFTTAPAEADFPSLIGPMGGSVCQPTSLKFDWSDAPNAISYTLQVDNNDDFSSPVINQSGITASEYDVSGLSGGTKYRWHVASSNGCKTSRWSVSPYFTTADATSTPSLSGPSAGAGCQPTTLTLTWNSISGASSYDVRVDDNSDFGSPVLNQTDVAATSTSVSGLNAGTTYYWTVRAKNSCGNASTWSDARTFTTAASLPSVPSPTSPSNGVNCQPTSLTLDWGNASNASSYSLQVDNNSNFSSPVTSQSGITASEFAVSGLSGGTAYYWRVSSANSCNASAWSTARTFTTAGTPSTPSLSLPANSAGCQSTSLTLTWSNTSEAATYDLRVDDNSDFGSPVSNQMDLAAPSASLSGLGEGTTYYWAVRAKNSCGNYSAWSDARTFTTAVSSLSAPSPASPADGEGCQPLTVTLSWGSVSGAISYTLQVDDHNDFGNPFFNQADITSGSKSVSELDAGATYYWRVRAANSCGSKSSWSTVRSFKTLVASIEKPVLEGPSDNDMCQSVNPFLSWGNVPNATGYTVQVDDNDDFGSPAYNQCCTGNTHTCSGLTADTRYYWRVSASAPCDVTGSWSDSRSFETRSGVMATPSLAAPDNYSTEQPLILTLQWNAITDAVRYRFQLDDNEDFASPVYSEELSDNFKLVSGLTGDTTYYWHIRAGGECTEIEWSETWQFRTEAIINALFDANGNDFVLEQNYPNPFTGTTVIGFSIPAGDRVTIEFCDLQGRIVGLYAGYYPAGKHSIEISLSDKVQAGIYLYRMRTGDFTGIRYCVFR